MDQHITTDLGWYKQVYDKSFGPGGAYVAMRSVCLFMEAYYNSADREFPDRVDKLLRHAFEIPAQKMLQLYLEQCEHAADGEFDLEEDIEFMRQDFALSIDKFLSKGALVVRAILQLIVELDTTLENSEEKTDLRKVRIAEEMPINKQVVKTIEAMCRKLSVETFYARKQLKEDNRPVTNEGNWITRDGDHYTNSLKPLIEERIGEMIPNGVCSVSVRAFRLKGENIKNSQER